MITAQEHRDQDQPEEKGASSGRPKSTAQERRDLSYLEGYGVGLAHVLSHQELTGHTIAFVRGYQDALMDREASRVLGGEPA